MTFYVYSTSTCSNYYCSYYPSNKLDSVNRIERKVLIKGGHGVAHSSGNTGIWTPQGVVTEVSDEEMAFLEKNDLFMQHVKAGFIMYHKKRRDPADVIKDMTPKDRSAPLTPDDYDRGSYSGDNVVTYKPKLTA